MPDFYAKTTDIGRNKIAGFATGGAIVNITQIAVGDANGAYYDPTGDEAALVNEVHRRAISKVYTHPSHADWIVAEAIIPATVGGFSIREVMLLDNTGAGVAIAKYPLTELPVPGSGSAKDVYIRVIFQVADASAVEQSIDPSLIMATQEYVDVRMPRVVRAAATGNANPIGLQTIDGVVLVENDLVLLPLQIDGTQNGIYVVHADVWTRSFDADNSLEIIASMLVIVPEGTVNADTIWMLTTNAPITLGTTQLVFTKILPDERQRTIADTVAPAGDTGTPTTLLGWLAYMIKGITGKASWRTAPVITLEAAKAALDTKAPLASPSLTGVPLAPTAAPGTNTTQISSTAFVQAAIAALLDSTPGTLDTLNELAAALGDDPNFATTITNVLAGKQPLIAAGTESQYFRGDKTWQNLPSGSFKNKIIGGDFSTNPWQRGTAFSGVSGNYGYTADRFRMAVSAPAPIAAVSVNRAVDAPTVEQAGVFTRHCLQVDVTTADAAVAATDVFSIIQPIEGYNAASFGFGQAGTRHVTLSFWVRSSKTGIHCVSLRNSELSRSYVAEYTVDVANTWEKKVITVPVDTAGTWLYDNRTGVYVTWALMSGANFHTIKDTWQGSVAGNGYVATSNQVNVMDNVNGDFRLALIQLEEGTIATPFEHRDIGTELMLCQRYCETFPAASLEVFSTAPAAAYGYANFYSFKTTKRANPSLVPAVSFSTVNGYSPHATIRSQQTFYIGVSSVTQGSVSATSANPANFDCEL